MPITLRKLTTTAAAKRALTDVEIAARIIAEAAHHAANLSIGQSYTHDASHDGKMIRVVIDRRASGLYAVVALAEEMGG